MTQDEIIELAKQAGVEDSNEYNHLVCTEVELVTFAKLVAEKEREACAKLCETLGVHPTLNIWHGGPDWYKHGKDCAAAIRTRGQA